MDIDLGMLKEMHPELPTMIVVSMRERAALALQRNGHASGVRLAVEWNRALSSAVLSWPEANLNTMGQHDLNRVTEDGAEAVALAVAHRYRSWRVVRRMQRRGYADWLLESVQDGVRTLVAFEISGVDKGSVRARLSEKCTQVSRSRNVNERWAGVVGFEQPTAALQVCGTGIDGN
jgi:hypothetical protein